MMTRVLFALVLTVPLAGPLHADVRYTTQVAVRDTNAPPDEAASPLLALIRTQLLETMAPSGSAQFVLAASGDAVRIEFTDGTAGIPKGGVFLMPPHGAYREIAAGDAVVTP